MIGSWGPARAGNASMLRLSDNDLSPEEKVTKQSIRAVLGQSRGNSARDAVAGIAERSGGAFFRAALSILLNDEAVEFLRRRCVVLLERPALLAAVVDPQRLTWPDALAVCRDLMKVDPWLDLRLARLAPARSEDIAGLGTAPILRLLDILQEISNGPRLIAVLGHLAVHPNPQIASKAALFLGRRIHNPNWTSRLNNSADARMRANAIEALWGRNVHWARHTFLDALTDENNRVVGNALLGLHLLGERDFRGRVTLMLADSRPPFRSTAAWVMGRSGDTSFLPLLQQAMNDPEGIVRSTAMRALIALRRPATAPPAPPAPEPVPEPQNAQPEPTPPEPAPPEPAATNDEVILHLDGRHIGLRKG